ncbi:hypothetical protein [Streptomyces sp. NPDC056463]|uniref:hypothetical protein n=1 Tax=Streptomyces sp. NPDC056463 TaxID=3345827 RepID=UPI0036C2A0EC
MDRSGPHTAQAGECRQPQACRCFFAHPQNDSQRAEIASALRAARQAGDAVGTLVGLAQLGPCPARAAKEAR